LRADFAEGLWRVLKIVEQMQALRERLHSQFPVEMHYHVHWLFQFWAVRLAWAG
jgi:hypothetical protein